MTIFFSYILYPGSINSLSLFVILSFIYFTLEAWLNVRLVSPTDRGPYDRLLGDDNLGFLFRWPTLAGIRLLAASLSSTLNFLQKYYDCTVCNLTPSLLPLREPNALINLAISSRVTGFVPTVSHLFGRKLLPSLCLSSIEEIILSWHPSSFALVQFSLHLIAAIHIQEFW